MEVLQRQAAQACVLLAAEDDRLTLALEYILLTSNFRVLAANDSAALGAHLRAETPDALWARCAARRLSAHRQQWGYRNYPRLVIARAVPPAGEANVN